MIFGRRFIFKTCILCQLVFSQSFATNTINGISVLRNFIIKDKHIHQLYIDKNIFLSDDEKLKSCSMEHIFPRSYLDKIHHNDLHNIGITLKNLNINRSNYFYTEEKDADKNWIDLEYDNKVNHKRRLFIPNKCSRGVIARAILYMSKEYNYCIKKIIDKNILLKWFYQYPPTDSEIYYNELCKNIQNTNNIFVSKYNKKSLKFTKIFKNL